MLRAARELLLEHGLEVSLEQIALHAGLTRQSLYNHFSSKADLLMQVFEVLNEELQAQLENIGDAASQDLPRTLQQIALTVQTHLYAPSSLRLHRLLVQASAQMPDLLQSMHQRRTGRLRQRLSDLLQRLDARGDVSVASPMLAASAFIGAAIGYAYPGAMLNGQAPDRDSQQALAAEVVATFLAAWRYRAAAPR
ncbi:TetR/AcrR family transcriptional regulator [Xanthomonas translucens pv. undulosa]|nr:transcriptional regulator [Xanthomonas translucens pv. undulosa]QSQ43596.1 TetR/AcrR family transcriptional regulator [Xanthomonas translucens pv. translucens]UKE45351.1 TetR/AcrR family transcriptional regulator [Xanthomonas translucens pv. secalis]MBC3971618.1 TetR/AcrR family transcriptional regulator [Xanthomonas translucens pv. undulosa]QEN95467.1 TetR/AcrR family transcriptional regulator [Xanthomonas translucens pv. undulosa]